MTLEGCKALHSDFLESKSSKTDYMLARTSQCNTSSRFFSTLITNVLQYAGPGCVPVLLKEKPHVPLFCHDKSFSDASQARAFELEFPGVVALTSQTPQSLFHEILNRGSVIHAVIHNDVHPNQPMPIEEIPLDMFQTAFDSLVLFPVQLTQLFLPNMKSRRQGCFVFVTSARYRQPEPGFAVATSIRSTTTSFALALAREAAPFNIQVNVVAPNYLYSEAYYPRARFVDSAEGRAVVASKVPMGRLGKPTEIGELVSFLASGRSQFLSGQVIDFTGGWP
jgi:NAD(P)-dependent dehydrogenase (short-subunit alcohol dehydrogenase family)